MKEFVLALGAIAVIAAASIGTSALFSRHPYEPIDRTAAASLKTLATAEADFRANDRSKSGKDAFWRADVAGLFTIIPKGGDPEDSAGAIKLIEVSVAGADDRPVGEITKYVVRAPKAGYWYRAIRHADEKELDPRRFAFCCFPDRRPSGRWTFIVDESNVIYKKDLGDARGIEVYPPDPLKDGWRRLD